jgi:hypothetical protein
MDTSLTPQIYLYHNLTNKQTSRPISVFVCYDSGSSDHLFVRLSGSKQALVREHACLSDTLATVEPCKVDTFGGQAISVPLEGNLVKVDNQVLSFSTVEMTTGTGSQQDDTLSTVVFTTSGRAITAMVRSSSLVL